jgi:hypothetical protein
MPHPQGREFFLSQFLEARAPKDFKLPWRLLLDQDPAEVARQFLREGLLQETERGWSCSANGRSQAQAYLQEQAQARSAAQAQVRQAFGQGDYERAARAYLAFESQQPFPADKALNPTQSSLQSLIEDLAALAGARPARMGSHSAERTERAALAWLWGTDSDPELDILTAYLTNLRDLQRYRAEGLPCVQIVATNPEDCCPPCRRLHEQFFDIHQVPEIPAAECQNSPPCPILYLPELDPTQAGQS